jgi:PAS domain S-box-containing protein
MESMADQIRLLHVDDQPDFLHASAEFLERTDDQLVVETATSPREGLEILDERQIDCVVSDYEMPRIDGIEFLERVQEEYPDLPFILFTGRGSEEIASDAISAGVTDYLQKHQDTEQYELLANRIRNAVTQYRAEQDLEQIRDFFTGAERLGKLGAWEIDRDGNLVWTEGVKQIHEVGEEFEPTIQTALEFYHPADRDRVEQAAIDARDNGESYHLEARLTTAEGNDRWVWTSGEPVDSTGDGAVVRGYIQDITEQKRRERELERINKRLRTIVSNAPLVLFVLGTDGIFEVSQGKALNKLGLEPGELEGKSIRDVYSSNEAVIEAYERALEGERVNAVQEVGEMFFETTYQPVEEDGAVTAVVGVAVDITERRQREQSLTALQEATRTLVNAETRQAIHEILIETAEEILGFDIVTVDTAEDGHLKQVASSFDPDDKEHYQTLSLETDDTFATRAYNNQETIVVDDVRRYGEIEAADSEYRSGLTVPIGEYGVFQGASREVDGFDETDRELAQLLVEHARVKLARLADQRRIRERTAELERQNERLEEVTSIVSHDLRNPLNVASLRLDQVRQERDDEHLETIAQSHDRMQDLIDDLLLLAQGGELVEEIGPVDLSALTGECWETVDTAGADLVVETDAVVEADRQRLRQLLENLVGNAVEHGVSDEPSVANAPDDAVEHGLDEPPVADAPGDAVEHGVSDEPSVAGAPGDADEPPVADTPEGAIQHGGDSVTVTVGDLEDGFYVEDDGQGVPEEDRAKIFESGYSTEPDGTGFGLAIVEQIAQAHDWEVSVTDGDAGGARFEIRSVRTRNE